MRRGDYFAILPMLPELSAQCGAGAEGADAASFARPTTARSTSPRATHLMLDDAVGAELLRTACKVMTLVGTRPEIIKLSASFAELDRAVKHVLVHTGQNYDYELNQIFFDGLGLRKPDHFLNAAGETAAKPSPT